MPTFHPLHLWIVPTAEPSDGDVQMLAEMGFTPAQARKALLETVRN